MTSVLNFSSLGIFFFHDNELRSKREKKNHRQQQRDVYRKEGKEKTDTERPRAVGFHSSRPLFVLVGFFFSSDAVVRDLNGTERKAGRRARGSASTQQREWRRPATKREQQEGRQTKKNVFALRFLSLLSAWLVVDSSPRDAHPRHSTTTNSSPIASFILRAQSMSTHPPSSLFLLLSISFFILFSLFEGSLNKKTTRTSLTQLLPLIFFFFPRFLRDPSSPASPFWWLAGPLVPKQTDTQSFFSFFFFFLR